MAWLLSSVPPPLSIYRSLKHTPIVHSPHKDNCDFAIKVVKPTSKLEKTPTKVKRFKRQNEAFVNITKSIHGEGKQAFLDSLEFAIGHSKEHDLEWQLDGDDLVRVLQGVKTKEGSLWDRYIDEAVRAKVHVSEATISMISDNYSGRNLLRALRKELGRGILSSEVKVLKHRHSLQEEFNAVMQPTETQTGYRVNPARLVQVLRHLYYFLPNEEWWRLWGDGREVSKTKQCSIQLSCINNEMVLNGYEFHSPKNIHPIAIFYGSDSRFSLEGNIGSPGGRPGFLEEFVQWLQSEESFKDLCTLWTESSVASSKSALAFFIGDSMFLDGLVAAKGELHPTKKTDGFNMYIRYPEGESRTLVDTSSGFRSGLGKTINRELTDSLVPSIPLFRIIFCIDHGVTRIVEKMVFWLFEAIAKEIDVRGQAADAIRYRKRNTLISRMCQRGIAQAARIKFSTGGMPDVQSISLSHEDARVLLKTPAEFGGDCKYSPLLDDVVSTTRMFQIDWALQKAMGVNEQSITELTLVSAIWSHLNNVVTLLRNSDEKPSDPSNGQWGMTPAQQNDLQWQIDMFHKCVSIRYPNDISPYMLKLADCMIPLLKCMPVPAPMRFSTEGSENRNALERAHMEHHTAKGGGNKTLDPIQSVFLWDYREIRRQIDDLQTSPCPEGQQSAATFSKWVKRHVAAYRIQKWYKYIKKRNDVALVSSNACGENNSDFSMVRDIVVCGTFPKDVVEAIEDKCKQSGHLSLVLDKSDSNQNMLSHVLKHSPRTYRLLSSNADQLPPEGLGFVVIVVTHINTLTRTPIPKVIDAALKRNWPIVSFEFVKAVISEGNGEVAPYMYNLDENRFGHLRTRAASKIKTMSPKQLHTNRGDVRGITLLKRKAKQSKPKPSNPSDETKNVSKKHKVSSYMNFFNEYTKTHSIIARMPLKQRHEAVKIVWQQMSPAAKQSYTLVNKEPVQDAR